VWVVYFLIFWDAKAGMYSAVDVVVVVVVGHGEGYIFWAIFWSDLWVGFWAY
jgi:hypothetical protein